MFLDSCFLPLNSLLLAGRDEGTIGRDGGYLAKTTLAGRIAMPVILWLLGVPLSLVVVLWLMGVV
jgi:hypothetical protein